VVSGSRKRRIVMPTLDLTDEEADAVRSALAQYADRMEQRGALNPDPDWFTQERLCDAVVEKLNKAEGRG
jgi:hypothetical protein